MASLTKDNINESTPKTKARSLTVSNIYAKKNKTFPLTGQWQRVLGNPEMNGCWLIWGAEKNGKTWLALTVASMLSEFDKALYISAEEGTGDNFKNVCQRAGLEANNRSILFNEYLPLDELKEKISMRKSPRIVFIDNLTIYNDEFKNGEFRKLIQDFSHKLFICLAHEERGEPYTSTAKLCKKLAKVIMHVKGLACTIYGRVPGGIVTIDEEKAQLYWGTQILKGNESGK